MHSIFTFLAGQPVLFLFVLIGVGMAFGRLRVRGIGLGAAAVLFTAIALAAWAQAEGVELRVPESLGTLGLALFAFTIGLNSGASFFRNLRQAIWPMVGIGALYVVVAALAASVGRGVFGMSSAAVAGTFAGATTNTPALAAAGQASGDLGGATVAYSISYLWGVIGMMLAAFAALQYGKHDTDAPSPLVNRTIRVQRDDHPFLADVAQKVGGGIAFSRLRRGEQGPVVHPDGAHTLDDGDLLTVVGTREQVDRVAAELGRVSSRNLVRDRTFLDFRRVTVSNPALMGRSIADLHLGERFSATVTRVRRGDVDMVGTPDVVLREGDRVRIVAPAHNMREISRYFGDSASGLTDVNPVALGLGMAAGILLGELPIFTPTGAYFTIGSAAGTLLVGLVLGRLGRIGPVVTTLPQTASQVLMSLGLLMFLAQAGANAGGRIAEAFGSGAWVHMLILGFAITSLLGLGIYALSRWVFHMGGTRLSGLLAGAQTQPAILGFANSRTNSDPRVTLGYALIYPAAMIGKILVAQVLGGL